MVSRDGLNPATKLYVWSVIIAGFGVVGGSIYQIYVDPIGREWFILAAITLISGSATIKLPSAYATISISETFVFTAVLLYGPAAGTLIVTLDALVGSFWLSKRHHEFYRALFNMSAPAVSAWCSAHVFFAVARIAPLVKEPSPVTVILPALLLFALTYFALNSWLITLVIAATKHLKPFTVWKASFAWLSLNYFGGASVAFLLVGYNRTITLSYIGAIIPLLFVLYLTFKTATGRVEDADRHIKQLNTLYLSTIETLAMAIDAKDQVTHGHIRRVQQQAIQLAHEVGVRDDKLVKAIEAAALLHDMGKLAVPEHILNKPGKLTQSEFEKMKLHASVGADILSAIGFPYPVVPIVRHHHENWDGTGYPAGLRGTDIPIGARILSVVDCFDALTSDRPYRPKMSDQDAVRILLERRGTMYDPLIVDTFIQIQDLHSKHDPLESSARHALNTIAHARRAPLPARSRTSDDYTTSADDMLSVYGLTAALAGHASLGDACDLMAKHLCRLIPASTCVFFVRDSQTDTLRAEHVLGDCAAVISGLSITVGQRLTGWVAANRETIVNSDAALDFVDLPTTPKLKTCISTPLQWKGDLIGVLTMYGSAHHSFSDDDRRIIEAVAPQIAYMFHHVRGPGNSARRDSLTGLPRAEQLEELIRSIEESGTLESHHALLFVDVRNLKHINAARGRAAGDEVLRHVVKHVRAGLRTADILFRPSGDDFVAFLGATDRTTAEAIGSQIQDSIGNNPVILSGSVTVHVDATVTVVCSPHDGHGVRELVACARQRRPSRHTPCQGPSIH